VVGRRRRNATVARLDLLRVWNGRRLSRSAWWRSLLYAQLVRSFYPPARAAAGKPGAVECGPGPGVYSLYPKDNRNRSK